MGAPMGQTKFVMNNCAFPPNFASWMSNIVDPGYGTPNRMVGEFQEHSDATDPVNQFGMYHPNKFGIYYGVGPGVDRIRLAKSFTLNDVPAPPPAFPSPAAFPFSTAATSLYTPVAEPSDLRIDGQYIERGSVPAYIMHDLEAWNQSSAFASSSSWRFNEGTTSFWMKPNWFPESTGKIRKLLSMSRYRQHQALYKTGGNWNYTDRSYTSAHPAGEVECSEGNAWVEGVNPTPFALYYMPAHVNQSGSAPTNDSDMSVASNYNGGVGKFRPASLGFGLSAGADSGGAWNVIAATNPSLITDANIASTRSHAVEFVVTPPLNHEAHVNDSTELMDPLYAKEAGNPLNWLRGHEWVHITASWKMSPGVTPNGNGFQIFVNGATVPGTKGLKDTDAFHPVTTGNPPTRYNNWWLMPYESNCSGCSVQHNAWHWGSNGIRLGGEPNEIALNRGIKNPDYSQSTWPYPHVFTADATFDEFFHWTFAGAGASTAVRPIITQAADLWDLGRYYHPLDTTNTNLNEATYTSKAGTINLSATSGSSRALPPMTAEPTPAASEGFGGPGANIPVPSAAASTQIIGIGWTVYGEAYNPAAYGAYPTNVAMIPYLRNWVAPASPTAIVQPNIGLPSQPVESQTHAPFAAVVMGDMYVVAGATTLGPYRDEAFSPIYQPGGSGQNFTVPTADLANVRIRYRFRVGVADPILLSSPILDDVTLYYSQGGTQYLLYYFMPN